MNKKHLSVFSIRADAFCITGMRINPSGMAELLSPALLCATAEADLEANSAFWDSYEGPVRETSERINDTYLKVNGQADGVKSYDRMVDLIVAYFNFMLPV